ncbi:MAG TPA: MBL fold metallo-hydrolase [Nitriliruptorales bacterium]
MDVVVLGSGSPLPDPRRAGPATLVTAGEHHLLVDTGRGVLMRLAATGVGVDRLDAVLLTHLHSDHVTDLADVITTHWIFSFEPRSLRVIGPAGTQALVDATLAALETDIGYRTRHHEDLTWSPIVEVDEVSSGDQVMFGDLTVTVATTAHQPVEPTVAYRVTDHEGAAAVLAGDTVPCADLDRLTAGAGVLVHTVIRKDLIEHAGLQRMRDICDYHSGTSEVAQTAARAGVDTLVLTHLVPAPADDEAAAEWSRLVRDAGYHGDVVVADDLDRVKVPPSS